MRNGIPIGAWGGSSLTSRVNSNDGREGAERLYSMHARAQIGRCPRVSARRRHVDTNLALIHEPVRAMSCTYMG
jgi:hypothetical protein